MLRRVIVADQKTIWSNSKNIRHRKQNNAEWRKVIEIFNRWIASCIMSILRNVFHTEHTHLLQFFHGILSVMSRRFGLCSYCIVSQRRKREIAELLSRAFAFKPDTVSTKVTISRRTANINSNIDVLRCPEFFAASYLISVRIHWSSSATFYPNRIGADAKTAAFSSDKACRYSYTSVSRYSILT